MEGFFETVTRGNVAEVKILLASVVAALAVYQLALIAVGYGRVRLPFLAAVPAARTHRAIGDGIVVTTILVALMCLSGYGFEDGGTHAVAGIAVLGAILVKVALVRRGGERGSRLIPLAGLTLFALLTVAWATSAGDFLADR
jgi:hypothetical protein